MKKNKRRYVSLLIALSVMEVFIWIGVYYSFPNLFSGTFVIVSLIIGAILFSCMNVYTILIRRVVSVDKSILPYRRAWLLLPVAWLPTLIAFYPGSVPFDGFYMLNMFCGSVPKTNSHPYLATLLMGGIVKIGSFLSGGNYNFGIFLYILFQSFALAIACWLSLIYLKRWGVSGRLVDMLFVFYMFNPIILTFGQIYVKDTLFGAVCLLFSLFFTDSVLENDSCQGDKSLKKNTLLIGSGILMSLLRHNGIVIVLITLTVGLLLKGKKVFLKAICIVGAVYLGFNTIGLNILEVETAQNTKANLNLLKLQQTARYVNKHKDTIPQEEWDVINRLLEPETFSQYDPYLSDPIAGYHGTNNEDWEAYLEVWEKEFVKDPKVYLGAYAQFVYLYIFPFDTEHFSYSGKFEILESMASTEEFQIYRPNALNQIRNMAERSHYFFREFPITRCFYASGTYSWILLLGIGYWIYRKKYKMLMPLMPALVNFVICVGGFFAVNGSIRYSLPVIFTVPYLFCFVLNDIGGRRNI